MSLEIFRNNTEKKTSALRKCREKCASNGKPQVALLMPGIELINLSMKSFLLLILLSLALISGCVSEDSSSFKILSRSKHPNSKYLIVVEDYNYYFGAYLYEKNSLSPICGCFVGTTKEPLKEVQMPAPYNGNPPISDQYASKQAIFNSISKESIQFRWSNDGKVVVIYQENDPVCMLDGGQRISYSKAVKKDGAYGEPWDRTAFLKKMENTI